MSDAYTAKKTGDAALCSEDEGHMSCSDGFDISETYYHCLRIHITSIQ